jgi:hypothetical protein
MEQEQLDATLPCPVAHSTALQAPQLSVAHLLREVRQLVEVLGQGRVC